MKIILRRNGFTIDQYKLEGEFSDIVNRVKNIYKDVACQLDFTRDSIIVNIINS